MKNVWLWLSSIISKHTVSFLNCFYNPKSTNYSTLFECRAYLPTLLSMQTHTVEYNYTLSGAQHKKITEMLKSIRIWFYLVYHQLFARDLRGNLTDVPLLKGFLWKLRPTLDKEGSCSALCKPDKRTTPRLPPLL